MFAKTNNQRKRTRLIVDAENRTTKLIIPGSIALCKRLVLAKNDEAPRNCIRATLFTKTVGTMIPISSVNG